MGGIVAATALLASCSTVPPRRWPAHAEATVLLEFRAASGGLVPMPVSRPDLTILELEMAPPAREQFRDGKRYLALPPDCSLLLVRCRYRAYAGPDGVPPPEVLFPGAAVLERTAH